MVIGAQQIKPDLMAIQAFEKLKHDGLQPTPNNYAVYYYYFTGTNTPLKNAIDEILAHSKGLSQEQCEEFFQKYLGSAAEHKILKDTNAAIEEEIRRVLNAIDKAANGASDFSKSLDTFSGKLSASSSLDQIRDAVTHIVTETRSVAQQNEKLSEQLTQTTQQLSEVRQNLDQVHRESQIDPLTEVGNRKFFETEFTRAMGEARDNGQPLSMLMIDIDHFKKFNDTHGHLIGDQVLRLVAHTLVENLKGRDVIARFGGEEFVILLPHTKVGDAEKVGNQLRASLATKHIRRRSTHETLGAVTISIGAAEYCPGEAGDDVIARADKALYQAKNVGRNRVISGILTPEEIAEIKAKSRLKF